jgi:hypothetical protein
VLNSGELEKAQTDAELLGMVTDASGTQYVALVPLQIFKWDEEKGGAVTRLQWPPTNPPAEVAASCVHLLILQSYSLSKAWSESYSQLQLFYSSAPFSSRCR